MRLDPERRHFVAVREPAWKAEIRTATICSAETGTPVGQTLELSGNLEDVALSPGCRQAALAFGAGDDDTTGFLEFRDIRTGRVHGRTPLASAASSLAWDPNGDRIAAICHSGQLLIACPGSNAPVTWAQPLESAPMQVHPFVAFTPEGSSLISLTPAGALEVREAATGQLRYPALRAEPIGFWNFAVSRDGQILASTTRSGRVDVWNVQTGVRQGDPLYHPGWVYRCSFSADGTLLVTACHDGRSRVWDLRSGQQSGQPLAHPKEVYDAVFTPDGRWVLTASRDGGIRFWDWQSGGMVAPPFKVGDQAFTIDITADGQYAVIGSLDSTIHVLCLGLLKEKIPWGGSELRLLAEVVSGSVVARGMIRELTTAEWLQGARELRKIRPELLPPWWNPPVAISAKNACPRAVDSVAGAVDKAASAAACPNSSACGNKDCPSSAQPKDQLPL